MANVTYHDHPAGAAPDGTEEVPGWQASGAKKFVFAAFKQARVNPTPVSAAGTDQSGATALSNSFDYHSVGTVGAGAGTKFAALTSSQVGQRTIVCCDDAAANTLTHYPPSGGKINGQSVNVGVSIEPGSAIEFLAVSTVNWRTISP